MLHSIETRADWWDLLDVHWDDIHACIGKYLSLTRTPDPEDGGVENPEEKTLGELLPGWKEQRDDMLLRRVLDDTVTAAQDDSASHENPGWHILCDLCAESDVLYDEDEG